MGPLLLLGPITVGNLLGCMALAFLLKALMHVST